MAGKVNVRVIAAFFDKQANALRKLGDECAVTTARLKELNACGPEQNYAPLVEVVKAEPEPEEVAE